MEVFDDKMNIQKQMVFDKLEILYKDRDKSKKELSFIKREIKYKYIINILLYCIGLLTIKVFGLAIIILSFLYYIYKRIKYNNLYIKKCSLKRNIIKINKEITITKHSLIWYAVRLRQEECLCK